MIIIIIRPVIDSVNKATQIPPRRVFRYELNLASKVVHAVGLPESCELTTFQRGVDEDLLLNLNNAIFVDHPDQGAWNMGKLMTKLNESLRTESDIQVLLHKGYPVAYFWLKHHQLLDFFPCEIYVLGVLKRFRGIGVGNFLVSEALKRMQEFSCERAWVYTDESNLRARNLYERFGFRFDLIEEL